MCHNFHYCHLEPNFFFFVHQNFGTQNYAKWCANISEQLAHYAEHLDRYMDFSQSGLHRLFLSVSCQAAKLMAKAESHPVWKIPIHYAGRPSTLMCWTRCIAAPSSHRLRQLGAQEIAANLLSALGNCSFLVIWNILLTFLSSFPNFGGTYSLLWPFSWPFWASFASHVSRDSLMHQEFHHSGALSWVQAILCWTHPNTLGTIIAVFCAGLCRLQVYA